MKCCKCGSPIPEGFTTCRICGADGIPDEPDDRLDLKRNSRYLWIAVIVISLIIIITAGIYAYKIARYEFLIRDAVAAEEKGNSFAAENYYREAIAKNPAKPEAYRGLGKLLINDAKYEEALTAVNEGLKNGNDEGLGILKTEAEKGIRKLQNVIVLNKYISIEFEGNNTRGFAYPKFDTTALIKDCSAMWEQALQEGKISKDDIPLIWAKAEYKLSSDSLLSNGDKIKLSWDIPEVVSDFSEVAGFTLDASEDEYQVEGLSDIAEINPFEGLVLTFEGINGEGKVKFTGGLDYISYEAEKNEKLSNGEKIAVMVKYKGNGKLEDYLVSTRGVRFSKLIEEYEVLGLSEYVTSMEQLPEDFLAGLNKKANEITMLNTAVIRDGVVIDNYKLISNIFLTKKNGAEAEGNNYLFSVYSYDVTKPDGKKTTIFFASSYSELMQSGSRFTAAEAEPVPYFKQINLHPKNSDNFYVSGFRSYENLKDHCLKGLTDKYDVSESRYDEQQ